MDEQETGDIIITRNSNRPEILDIIPIANTAENPVLDSRSASAAAGTGFDTIMTTISSRPGISLLASGGRLCRRRRHGGNGGGGGGGVEFFLLTFPTFL